MYNESWNVQYENECRGGPPFTPIHQRSYCSCKWYSVVTLFIAVFIWMSITAMQMLLPSSSSVINLGIMSSINTWTSFAGIDGGYDDNYIRPYISTINFTLQRQHYNVLPMFNKKNMNADEGDDDTDELIPNYQSLNSYQAIIEPYANMYLYIHNSSSNKTVLQQQNRYIFTICLKNNNNNIHQKLNNNEENSCQRGQYIRTDDDDDDDTDKTIITGPNHIPTDSASAAVNHSIPINFKCTPYDTFTIVVHELNSDNKIINSVNGKGICMYVRREIRSLTTEDLNTFLDTSHMLHTISDDEGMSRYGSKYRSSSYLQKFHFYNAAQKESDHIHEGNGFLMQHIKITNIFEQAIQAINPSISLPYWDYTIDSEENRTAINTIVSHPSMFGSTQTPIDKISFTYELDDVIDARIKDGRWSNITAEMNTIYPDLYSGYGYLRSPWNLNPSPYVSRYTLLRGRPRSNAFPSCLDHYELLQMDDLMDFYFDMQLLPHGAVHIELGGAFGCDILRPMLEQGYIIDVDNLYGVCRKWFIIIKEGYRANYFYPTKNCNVNKENHTESLCPFVCTSAGRDHYYSLFRHVMSDNIYADKEYAEDVWYDFICHEGSKIFTGDHLESASPSDPTFWIIHPTLERLFQTKLMTGGFPNEKWENNAKTEFVCNKAKCYHTSTNRSDYYDDCCYGHYEFDQMLDGSRGRIDKDNYHTIGMTNRETQDATDPRSSTYSMPYIYDSITWAHCKQQNFKKLLVDLRNNDIIYAKKHDFSHSMTTSNAHSDRNVGSSDSNPEISIDKSKSIRSSSGISGRSSSSNSKGISMTRGDRKQLSKHQQHIKEEKKRVMELFSRLE